jgi:hypothetical protein
MPDQPPGPFLVRDSNLTAKRLRSRTLDRTVWGVRASLGHSAELQGRCELLALRLGSGIVFSHTTAALLLGAPLPLSVERRPEVHVAVAAPASTPHARGLVGHRLALSSQDVMVIRGLQFTSPARTWCDLAAVLALDDLVAVGDFLIHHAAPLTSIAEIELALGRATGMRGIRRAREAVPLLSDRPESPQESKLRLILIRGGLPEPEINHSLVDTETGKGVRPDFRFRRFKLIIEYQGDYHRTKSQWRKDMTRRSRLEAQGWYVMELNADDLLDPDELVARIRTVLSRRR